MGDKYTRRGRAIVAVCRASNDHTKIKPYIDISILILNYFLS